jgi:hypothetical protein
MLHRPLKAKHYSRFAMGMVFLICGLLLTTENIAAGSAFLLLSAVIFYFAPRWNLHIELTPKTIRFSENIVETGPIEIPFSDLVEIRRVKEKEDRKGFFTLYPEFYAFIEFETHAGKTYRMHDIFSEDFDDALAEQGESVGIKVSGFSKVDGLG